MILNPAAVITPSGTSAGRIVEVTSFLSDECAIKLNNFLEHEIPPSWWCWAIHDGSKVMYHKDYKDGRIAHEEYQASMAAFRARRFSYSFRRTFDDHIACACPLCEFGAVLRGKAVADFVKSIFSSEVQLGEYFAARYEVGDFLSPHHDKENGSIGFVLYLSKTWYPEFGGNLLFLSDNWQKVKLCTVPSFNKLILFDIAAEVGTPHCVSHVNNGVRISITGWFKKQT